MILALLVVAQASNPGDVPAWLIYVVVPALVGAVVALWRMDRQSLHAQVELERARAERAESKLDARERQIADQLVPALTASMEVTRATESALAGMKATVDALIDHHAGGGAHG